MLAGEESVFCLREKRYLVYVWVQCDGSIVNVSDENDVLVWQSAPLSGHDAAQAFRNFYTEAVRNGIS